MNGWVGSWLAQVYLLSSLVLLLTGAGMALFRQPARRLFLARCGVAGLAASIPCAVLPPGTSRHPAREAGVVEAAQQTRIVPLDERLGCETPPPSPWLAPGGPAPLTRGDDPPSQPSSPSAPAWRDCCACQPVSASTPPEPVGADEEAGPHASGGADSPGWAGVPAVAFLTGSSLTAAWLGLGALATARLRRRTTEAPASVRATLAALVGGGRRPPEVRLCGRAGQPFAVGLWRPTIVLPTRFVERPEPAGSVEAALAHEWAHIRNGDLALLAALRLFLPVLFAHPAYWWLRHRVRSDQELLADASAVRGGDRIAYAEVLLRWAHQTRPRPSASLAGSLALWGRPSALRRRITLLLDERFRVEPACPSRWRLAIGLLAMSGMFLLVGASHALSASIAGAQSAASPHDCSDCDHNAPRPQITLFLCPADPAPARPSAIPG